MSYDEIRSGRARQVRRGVGWCNGARICVAGEAVRGTVGPDGIWIGAVWQVRKGQTRPGLAGTVKAGKVWCVRDRHGRVWLGQVRQVRRGMVG
jgi:hypothetical protein